MAFLLQLCHGDRNPFEFRNSYKLDEWMNRKWINIFVTQKCNINRSYVLLATNTPILATVRKNRT